MCADGVGDVPAGAAGDPPGFQIHRHGFPICELAVDFDLRARGVIPAELLAKLPDVSGAVFPTLDQLNVAKELITTQWDSAVGADVQAAP